MFTLLFETVQVITKVNSQIMSVQLLLELFIVLKNIKDASPPLQNTSRNFYFEFDIDLTYCILKRAVPTRSSMQQV